MALEDVDVRARPATGRHRGPSRIEHAACSAFPKLGWVATLDLERARLVVLHGAAVECCDEWIVEGVWDGPFEEGRFHRGAHLFGSGIRIDGDAVHFVPSCALVDRLVYCRDANRLLVSNSLVLLLAATDARLDPDHDYLREAKAVLAGVDAYDSAFAVLHASIPRFHQLYHKTLVVRGGDVAIERTIRVRAFTCFDDYDAMLRERLEAVCANASDPARRTRVAMYGTLSTGYDSTAVTSIVKDLGVRSYFTYVGSWSDDTKGRPEYETAPIAAALKVDTVPLEAPSPPPAEDELLLRAGSPLGHQIPLISMARHVEQIAATAAVFTGFHGDIIWDVNVPERFVSDGIIRHDVSGLDLSELRLKSGFFNVAVPFLFAASIESVVAISRSPEMAPWRLGTGYDRPISRRIAEEAGTPRDAFGFLKGGLFNAGMRPANLGLRARYMNYLRENVLPLPLLYARAGADRYTHRVLNKAVGFAKRNLRSRRLHDALLGEFWKFQEGYSWWGRRNLRGTLYAWAVMEAAARAARQMAATGAA